MEEAGWEVFLEMGKQNSTMDDAFCETLLRNALQLAEAQHGKRSAQTGICLIELSEHLERCGKQEEAELMALRYKTILCVHALRLGLTELTSSSS